jgi:hypothetical protein
MKVISQDTRSLSRYLACPKRIQIVAVTPTISIYVCMFVYTHVGSKIVRGGYKYNYCQAILRQAQEFNILYKNSVRISQALNAVWGNSCCLL